MRTHTLIFLVALSALLFFITGGYLYFYSQSKIAIHHAHVDAEKSLKNVSDLMTWDLVARQNEVKALAGMKEIQRTLENDSPENLARANALLKHFHNALDTDAYYLMDHDGNIIAASNYESPDSIVGKNYSFRPYFQQAVKGNPGFYFALGTASKKRGAYASYPVYGQGQAGPSGVLVSKVSMEHMEEWLGNFEEGYAVLTNEHGVIFAGNRKEWLFQLLWEVSPEKIKHIAESKQFGTGPWKWSGMKKVGDHHAVDRSGNKYMLHPLELELSPGWNLLYLHDLKIVSQIVYIKLFRVTMHIIAALCLLFGVSVFFLYGKAQRDIVRRKKAIEKLRRMSITDALTGVLNRRGFFDLATRQLKVASRMHGDLFLLYADLDNMKWINDNMGHKQGDEALKNAADVLRNTFRESDIIGRLGGDEFAVLLISADRTDNQQAIFERFEQNLKTFNEQNRKTYELRISTGIVQYDFEAPCSIEELMSRADTLMYENKKQRKEKWKKEYG